MSKKQDLNSSPLFQGIHEEDCRDMLSCFQAVRRSFRSEEVICDFSSDAVGIMESGEAVLIRIDVEGVSTVLENLGPGSVFGRPLAFAGTEHDSLEVLSCTPCGVIFIDHDQLFKRCRYACQRHNILLQNMLKLTVDKAQALSRRVDVLSRRCIREKLLCCFRQLSQQAGSKTFTLPFSLSVLAAYIAADRSAMMRELKRLREEGVVSSEGRRFTLYDPHS